ncbi:helix-turn-helix domain-containing protein [Lactiplantibacillus daowaiensis]|uniref:Helix-turn-helix domain-containing protein n=1 Tax=Lactiplantibacillus daowaiensis TaxID=2559918 RepID=A0ABW1RZD7_9LACO|nr:helix-turn-helix transcriptional regulator [Lactiplantibacillus daowaiensis]
MSKINDYIEQRQLNNPEFKIAFQQEKANLEAALAISDLRHSLHLSQRAFAQLVDKPQSTISRIEHGNMNVSTKVLSEIATATHKQLKIEFV